MLTRNYTFVNILSIFHFWSSTTICIRDEIRFAYLALISGRQMSIRASTMSIFLVAMTKNRA